MLPTTDTAPRRARVEVVPLDDDENGATYGVILWDPAGQLLHAQDITTSHGIRTALNLAGILAGMHGHTRAGKWTQTKGGWTADLTRTAAPEEGAR